MKNPSGRPNKFRGSRGPERSPARQAADAAGMSRHQFYQAMKIARIPEAEFEAMIEGDSPPTITQLAAHAAPAKPAQSPDRDQEREWRELLGQMEPGEKARLRDALRAYHAGNMTLADALRHHLIG